MSFYEPPIFNPVPIIELDSTQYAPSINQDAVMLRREHRELLTSLLMLASATSAWGETDTEYGQKLVGEILEAIQAV